jgi:hypothetical protein
MATDNCPNCGKPTATEYLERHDSAYCSFITSPDCWEVASGPVHYLVDLMTDRTACGSDEGSGSSTHEGSVTCPDCLARM